MVNRESEKGGGNELELEFSTDHLAQLVGLLWNLRDVSGKNKRERLLSGR